MSNEIKKLFLVEGEIFNGSNLQSTWYQAEVSARNKDHAETLARDEFRKQGAFQEVDIKSIECIDEIKKHFKENFTIAIQIKVYEGQTEEKLLATYDSNILEDDTLHSIMNEVENSLTDSEIAHLESKAINSEIDAELERGKREVEEWRENRQLLGHDMAEAIAIQRELEEDY
jgi:hypothetical protein